MDFCFFFLALEKKEEKNKTTSVYRLGFVEDVNKP